MQYANLNDQQHVRAININLLRHLQGGHKAFAKKLDGAVNWSYLSKMCLGIMPIEDFVARQVEQRLDIAVGWLDRKMDTVLSATNDDWLLISKIVALPAEPKTIATLILNYATKSVGDRRIFA